MRILFASGGSGGHIFPALSVIAQLKKRNSDIDIVIVTGRKDIERGILEKKGFEPLYISVRPFPRKFSLEIFSFFAGFIQSLFESASIFMKFKPDVVVGFGGYISCPVIILAALSGIPTLIHEQNLKLGLANRILKLFSKKVAVSFPKTGSSVNAKKVILTGNPVRDDLVRLKKDDALERFNFISDRLTILVMGGSQGSHSINENFISALRSLEPDLRSRIQIIHLAGLKDADLLTVNYKNLNVPSRIFSFLDNISFAYSASDLVISRAGSASISEILSFGLPSILIPYAYASAHQFDNASECKKNGVSIVLKDNKELSERISVNIKEFLDNRARLEDISAKAKKFMITDASIKIADEIIFLGDKKK